LHLYGIIQSRHILDPESVTPFCKSRGGTGEYQENRVSHVLPSWSLPSPDSQGKRETAAIAGTRDPKTMI